MNEIPFADSNENFRVGNIYCIGKNYPDHIKEFTDAAQPNEPVVFIIPKSALCKSGCRVSIPVVNNKKISDNIQNEVEIVLAVFRNFNNSDFNLNSVVQGIALGFDITLRDVQTNAKLNGMPWSVSKGFKNSAPISEIYHLKNINNEINFSLSINGETKQTGNTLNMIFSFEEILKYLNSIFALEAGDLIFTGTPSGVTSLNSGDILEGFLNNKKVLEAIIE